MDTELRKRLEVAAENYIECNYKDSITSDWNEKDFIAGAEWMFKECGSMTVLHDMRRLIIAQCKEWLKKNVPIIHTEDGDYVRVNMGHKNVPLTIYLADFEEAMNKLWEEQK